MLEKRINQYFDLYCNAYRIKDYDGLADMYTDDAKIVTGAYGTYEGRDNIIAYARAGVEKMGVENVTCEIINVDQLNDLINCFGRFTYYGADGKSMGTFGLMTILKDVDGSLKIFRDFGA